MPKAVIPKFIPPAPVGIQHPIDPKVLARYENFDDWVLDFVDNVIALETSPSERERLDTLYSQMQAAPEHTKRARTHWDNEQANAKVAWTQKA